MLLKDMFRSNLVDTVQHQKSGARVAENFERLSFSTNGTALTIDNAVSRSRDDFSIKGSKPVPLSFEH